MRTTLADNPREFSIADTVTKQKPGDGAQTQKRREGYRRGLRSERLAVWFLRVKGYRILAKRVREPVGEIDIVARKARTLVFVEVKARPTLHEALIAVSKRQQRRIVAASEVFVRSQQKFAERERRFDVIAIVPGRLPSHIKDAWRPKS